MVTGSVAERSRQPDSGSNSNLWLRSTVDENPELYRLADAHVQIDDQTCPIMFLVGEQDNPSRNQPSRDKLKSLGIETGLKIYPDAKHGCWNRLPWFTEMVEDMDRFLTKHLLLILLIVFGLGWQTHLFSQQLLVTDIKSPRPNGWIVDLSGTVSDEAVENINRVCQEINERLGREMCVVVVPSTHGVKHREFATNLFNHWGVGKPGIPGAPEVWRDNGIMLFVATDDRQAWIALGDGIDGPEETRVAQQIIDDIVLPNYRAGDGNSALYEGIRSCATRIFSVSDLDAPATLPSVSGASASRPIRKHRRGGPITWIPWILGGSLIGGFGLLMFGRYYMRYGPRKCPVCSGEMVRLEEDQDDQFLNDSEQTEEQLGSVDYDVWACPKCEEVQKVRYGKLFTRYSKCPKCWYVTVLKIEDVVVRANYSHGGKVRVTEDCKSCDYHQRYTYRTPMRVHTSSSSSGGSFGGGGGSSGFSGGSSSGGGAGGGW